MCSALSLNGVPGARSRGGVVGSQVRLVRTIRAIDALDIDHYQ